MLGIRPWEQAPTHSKMSLAGRALDISGGHWNGGAMMEGQPMPTSQNERGGGWGGQAIKCNSQAAYDGCLKEGRDRHHHRRSKNMHANA